MECSVEDAIPECLQSLEDLLISKGNEIRANHGPGLPPQKTRRIWRQGSRVLQAKNATPAKIGLICPNSSQGNFNEIQLNYNRV